MSFSKTLACLFLMLSFLIAIVSAAESDVRVLNKDNFDEVIGKDDLVLVKFFAPWCGHCKAMKADFEKAATELKGRAVLADLDATKETELAEKHGIKGFPTLKLFSQGELLADYKGGRDKDSLVSYIERAIVPSVVELETEEKAKQFLSDNSKKIVFIAVKPDALKPKFKSLSMSMRDLLPDDLAFGSVQDASVMSFVSREVKDGHVIVSREDGSQGTFEGKEEDALEAFIKTNSVPAYGEITRENAAIYTDLPHAVYLVFQDPAKKNEKLDADTLELAKNHRGQGKLAFCWANAKELEQFVVYLGLKGKDPAVVIYSFTDDVKYLMKQEYSKENAESFIQDFVDDKLKPSLKSAPIPEKNDEPVKVVVGDTWKTIVEDESKDVLIEQYAPWCAHCKKLAPVLEELAKDLAGVETLVIAKMDATENDAPSEYKAKGYPTLHFFPAGGKDPIQYEEDREKKDFIEFLQKHATHKFEIPDAKKAAEKEDTSSGADKAEPQKEEKKEKEEL